MIGPGASVSIHRQKDAQSDCTNSQPHVFHTSPSLQTAAMRSPYLNGQSPPAVALIAHYHPSQYPPYCPCPCIHVTESESRSIPITLRRWIQLIRASNYSVFPAAFLGSAVGLVCYLTSPPFLLRRLPPRVQSTLRMHQNAVGCFARRKSPELPGHARGRLGDGRPRRRRGELGCLIGRRGSHSSATVIVPGNGRHLWGREERILLVSQVYF